jgi:hypothetical protein
MDIQKENETKSINSNRTSGRQAPVNTIMNVRVQ